MEFEPRVGPGRQVIQGYRPGGFTVAGVRHQGSMLVFPDRSVAWPVTSPKELDAATLEPVKGADPAVEILVIGTGDRFVPIAPALRELVRGWGIVIEAAATPAACRTYNLLLSEDRRVAAALIALPPEARSETGRP